MKHLLLATLAVALPSATMAAQKPNFVFILADDWGWGDLPAHGRTGLKTPNLDRLAAEGTDFHHFTVCSPVCSPSRTAIVTGQFPARHSIHHALASPRDNASKGMADWLNPKTTQLPGLMKQAGYATAHFGKWHLSGQSKETNAPLPAEYGYDEAAVWTGPGPGVFPGTSVADKEGKADEPQGAAHQTIAATDHALKFIRGTQGKPFYLNLWIHESHHLVAATDEDKASYPNTPEPERTYFSALTRADRQVGRVLDLLDELRMTDNTLVIFTSDNGPENSDLKPGQRYYFSAGDTGGLRGRKRSLYMGGVNVPFLIRWPGQVPAGRVDQTSLLSGVDMLPTLCAAAGIPLPSGYQTDGVNVLSAFRGQSFTRTQPLFWEWRSSVARDEFKWPSYAMREGNWGLVMNEQLRRIELYDLHQDRMQKTNVAAEQPERVASMVTAIQNWKRTLPEAPNPECVARPVTPVSAGKQFRKIQPQTVP